jgi:hypothetical protein
MWLQEILIAFTDLWYMCVFCLDHKRNIPERDSSMVCLLQRVADSESSLYVGITHVPESNAKNISG